MSERSIDTRLVYGFLDAGKTTYILDCIRNDFFYKYGSTLILCFEQGETEYDAEMLRERNAAASYYDGEEDVGKFCLRSIEAHRPDRIYVEMNTMMENLRERFPACMHVTSIVTWIDWETLKLYYVNFKQMIARMVAESQQVTFRGCPSRELLKPYSQAFRLMNHKASYLRQDPMGYHEKAFDLFLPFSLEQKQIEIPEAYFLPFWLDAHDHPEHYADKTIRFTDPLELRCSTDGSRAAGRVVMTCCMADLQFMAFELEGKIEDAAGGWITIDASARIASDMYGQKHLKLHPESLRRAAPPTALILDSSRTDSESKRNGMSQ